MKTTLKANSLVLAVAAAFALSATTAWAGEGGRDRNDNSDHARVNTSVSVHNRLWLNGGITVSGAIDPQADAQALVQGDQTSAGNHASNNFHANDAGVNSNVLGNASGNIGVNQAAGDDNIQSNDLALAAQDASSVFGQATSQVMFDQGAYGNSTTNHPAANDASLYNGVLEGASGNIGVNIAAGDSNVQRNAGALADGNNNLAVATISSGQNTAGNDTANNGIVQSYGVAGKTSGFASSSSWSMNGSFNAAISRAESGSGYRSRSEGGMSDTDGWSYGKTRNAAASGMIQVASTEQLAQVCTQYVPVPQNVMWSQDNASLSDNVLNDASGNIGVNIAAGSNNLQENALAMAASNTTRP